VPRLTDRSATDCKVRAPPIGIVMWPVDRMCTDCLISRLVRRAERQFCAWSYCEPE
jgi:hypothetical protein